jgi:hypothetical protein
MASGLNAPSGDALGAEIGATVAPNGSRDGRPSKGSRAESDRIESTRGAVPETTPGGFGRDMALAGPGERCVEDFGGAPHISSRCA